MEIEIIEMGIGYEVKITIHNIKLTTHKSFDTKEDAKKFLNENGLHEGFINLTMW